MPRLPLILGRLLAGAALAGALLLAPPSASAAPAQDPPAPDEATTTTTAPPNVPSVAPTTIAGVSDRMTQSTPDLTGVLWLWVLGIVGAVGTCAVTWWRRRRPAG